ncbi:MAG: hypothetical protein LBJ16_03000 [Holosporaceae bacterium]|jgi:hypothetical protein|nr:hypothetical protein [Holosporaceae bacterium]
MNNFVFAIILFSLLFVFMFWKNVKRYLFFVMKVCHDGSGGSCGCSCRPTSSPEAHRFLFSGPGKSGVVQPTARSIPTERVDKSLDRMSYFLAFNDEPSTMKYSATPLQDVDPEDLA